LKRYNRSAPPLPIADFQLPIIKTLKTALRKIGNRQFEVGNVCGVWRLDAKSRIIKLQGFRKDLVGLRRALAHG
jgi:hypothetical protein